MRAIRYERAKRGNDIYENIPDALDNGIRFLALIQRIAQARVYADDFVDVPENLLDKVSAPLGGDDVIVFEVGDPYLLERSKYGKQSSTEEQTSLRYSMSRTKSLSVYIASLIASCRFFSVSDTLLTTSCGTVCIQRVPGSYTNKTSIKLPQRAKCATYHKITY